MTVDEVIERIVSDVSLAVTNTIRNASANTSITGVHWQQGHPLEVISELQELSKAQTTKTQRYPLFALFRDFPEEKANGAGYTEVTLNCIIACRTEPTYRFNQRKEKSFRPILNPIYEEFMKQLRQSPRFLHNGIGIKHTKIDHYFWGRESIYGVDANIFQDWIDCIEIRGLKLKFYDNYC